MEVNDVADTRRMVERYPEQTLEDSGRGAFAEGTVWPGSCEGRR